MTPNAYKPASSEDVAAGQHDRQQLQADDQVDDAVAGAVAMVRFLKRRSQHAVFGHAVQHAVGADDRGVLRSGQNQHARPTRRKPWKAKRAQRRADQEHRQAADQVAEVCPA